MGHVLRMVHGWYGSCVGVGAWLVCVMCWGWSMVGMCHVLGMEHCWYGSCVEDGALLVWVMC